MIWFSILFLGFFFDNVALGSEERCSFVAHGTVSKEAIPSDTSLKKIDLFLCNVTNIEDSAFSNLDQLEQLFLHNNGITEIRQNTFAGLPNLDFLALEYNEINRIEDGALNLPKLTVLRLKRNELTTLSDTVFNQLPNLEYIDLSWNKLEHIGKSLNALQNVIGINLNHNRILDIDLKEFAKLPALSNLQLTNSGFDWKTQVDATDEFITSVDSHLDRLVVSNNNIKDSSFINKLKVFKNLKFLDAEENPYEEITWDASAIKETFPKLRRIDVGKVKLDDEHILVLDRALKAKDILLQYYLLD